MNSGISAQAVKNKSIIWLFLLVIVILNILPKEILTPPAIVLTGFMLGALIISIFAPADFGFLFNYFTLALGIRVFLSYLFYIASFVFKNDPSPGFLFMNDGFSFSQQGWEICRLAEKGVKITMENFMSDPNLLYSRWAGNITPYDFFTSRVYSITGHSPLSLFFISSVSGALSGIFIYLLAREIFSRRTAKIASLFAFFWPSFILWSTQHLKESVILMLLGIALWAGFYAYRHASAGFGILSMMAAFMIYKISGPIGIMAGSALLFAFALLLLRHLLRNKTIAFFTIFVIVVALLIIFHHRMIIFLIEKARYNVSDAGDNSLFQFLDFHRRVRIEGKLQIMKGFNISNPSSAMVFAPIGLIYAVFAPFPWQIGSLSQMLAVPETIIFYILVPTTIRGIMFAYKKRFWPTILLLSIIFFIVFALALIEGNSGTLFRHRAPAFSLLFIFTAAGFIVKKSKKLAGSRKI